MNTAIYPGSFDPPTNGHRDIIERASRIFDKVIVCIMENTKKKPLFSMEERLKMLQSLARKYSNVEVDYYRGLLVDYARLKNAAIVVKGLRGMGDFEYELQMALVNHQLAPDVETMFLMTSYRYSYLSSSIVKEIAYLGGDIKDLVPPEVHSVICEKIARLKEDGN